MNIVQILIPTFIILDGVVWIRFHYLLGKMRRRRLWRSGLAVFMLGAVGFAVILGISNPTVFRHHRVIPQWIPAAVFIWHFLILPVTFGAIFLEGVVRIFTCAKKTGPPPLPSPGVPEEGEGGVPGEWERAGISRRGFLRGAAFAAPPIATLGLAGIGVETLGDFRIKRYELALAEWPRGLDGFTIAFVADVHAGVFSSQKMLDDIADATNNLRAELILLGGDLINISHSDLTSALDMVCRLDSPNGLYMIQGNHDVIQGAQSFNDACAARGVPLILNDGVTIYPRGIAIQLLGIIWTGRGYEQHDAVRATLEKRDPSLFPIFLAHHPHAWDLAAANGIPLVLSGHTHGGQIMLTKRIGAGPLRFRYWSGLYQQPGSNLIVSNGVGDWFPLRVNAPAEIVHLTLRSQVAGA
jgi:uncharacterized protein